MYVSLWAPSLLSEIVIPRISPLQSGHPHHKQYRVLQGIYRIASHLGEKSWLTKPGEGSFVQKKHTVICWKSNIVLLWDLQHNKSSKSWIPSRIWNVAIASILLPSQNKQISKKTPTKMLRCPEDNNTRFCFQKLKHLGFISSKNNFKLTVIPCFVSTSSSQLFFHLL